MSFNSSFYLQRNLDDGTDVAYDKVDMKIYELDEEWGTWVLVHSLKNVRWRESD